ncbi:flagellar hook-associated protein 3 [Denitratisoma sp. DHT3]|uniref:flagellar hook-associated protein FlgL n=1 Tax=Denitratisoma sp. DHT3 TaxID=1981880 RepID=UPI001198A1DF|nr:flagellar hook-associated protein FlgL [Denitratisoma sp. DHT3]QDX81359.1 flagellar hook-associated protein 3 [Denitratisoma sp. DHT3]
MRVSTGMIFDSGVNSIQQRTSSLLRTQQQVSSGRRILTPSDDPVAAARALEVTQSKEINAQYVTAQGNAKSALGLMDGQLSSTTDLLVRIRELTVQAGNATLSAADRKSIATELRSRFDELVALANSTDGTGQYVFSGYQGSNKPFAGSVDSGVNYIGDDGLRTLRVSGSRNLPISQSGNDVFMRISNGNGTFVTGLPTERPSNIHSVGIDAGTITSPTDWATAPNSIEVRFWVDAAGSIGAAGATYYDLVDAGTGDSLFTGSPSATGATGSYTHAYTSGAPIAFSGLAAAYNPPSNDFGASVTVTGNPADGDKFSIDNVSGGLKTSPPTITHANAVIDQGVVTDPVKWSTAGNSQNLEVRFWVDAAGSIGAAGATYYDLVDTTTNKSLFTGAPSATGATGSYTHAYTSGTPISFSSAAPPAFDFGASVTVTGNPASGDAFTIKAGTDPQGNGTFVTAPKMVAAENMGSGIIGAGEVLDAAKWNSPYNSKQLEVRFWKDPADLSPNAPVYYDLVDTRTERSLFTDTASTSGGSGNTYTHVFKSGDPVAFSNLAAPYKDFGVSVTIQGTPASGDAFSLKNSTTQSVFDTLADLIKAIEGPAAPAGGTGNASLQNKLGFVLTNLSKIEDNISRVRAGIGTQLAEVEDLGNVSGSLDLQYASTLSNLQDLDYAKAITDLTRMQVELQAAQQSFMKISGMSLFNYL